LIKKRTRRAFIYLMASIRKHKEICLCTCIVIA